MFGYFLRLTQHGHNILLIRPMQGHIPKALAINKLHLNKSLTLLEQEHGIRKGVVKSSIFR